MIGDIANRNTSYFSGLAGDDITMTEILYFLWEQDLKGKDLLMNNPYNNKML